MHTFYAMKIFVFWTVWEYKKVTLSRMTMCMKIFLKRLRRSSEGYRETSLISKEIYPYINDNLCIFYARIYFAIIKKF